MNKKSPARGKIYYREKKEDDFMNKIKAVILAGGAGTRLSPITAGMPKPLVPIMGKPTIARTLSLLRRHGITNALVTLGYMADDMEKYFLVHGGEGVSLRLFREDEPLGTAGALPAIADELDDTFIVMSGDGVCDFNLSAAMDFHLARKARATLLVARSTAPTEFGCVSCDKNGKITQFAEKPAWRYVTDNKINTGIYILDKSIISLIKPGVATDFSRDVFPRLLGEIYAYEAKGYWCDIGRLDKYYACNRDALCGKIGGIDGSAYYIGENTHIADSAAITDGTVIGSGCLIGERCKIDKAILMDGVTAEAGAAVSYAIICEGVFIGAGAKIGRGCVIGANTVIKEGTVVPPKTKLPRASALGKENIIMDEKIFSAGNDNTFSESGIMGNIHAELNPRFCTAYGAALGKCFGDRGVFMNDGSAQARLAYRFIMGGAQAAGTTVTDSGEGFLSLLCFAASSGGFDFGVYAKHLKDGFCKIYVCDKFGTLLGMKNSRAVMREMASADFGIAIGSYLTADYRDKYAAFLSASCKPLEKMKLTVPETPAMRFFATAADRLGASVGFGIKNEIVRGRVFIDIDDDMGFEIAYAMPDGAYALIDRWHAIAALMQNDIENGEREIFLPYDAPRSLFAMADKLDAHAQTYADFLHAEKDDENDRMRAAGQIWQDDMLLALSYLSLADAEMNFPGLRSEADFAVIEEKYNCKEASSAEIISSLCEHGAQRKNGAVLLVYDSGTAYIRAAGEHELMLRAEAQTEDGANLTMEYTKNGIRETTLENEKIK